MAEFTLLLRQRKHALAELEDHIREADAHRVKETAAATDIQRTFRGWVVRKWLTILRHAACQVQRVFRGHCGRKHAAQARKNLLAQRQSLLFSYFATVIQSRFRGFYSRRYRHDFFARKRYIQGILDRSEALRKQLNEHAAAQAEEAQSQEAHALEADFRRVTQQLHHLVGTRAIPGIYNPPFDQPYTAFNRPVEEHLREGVREFLRTSGLQSVGVRHPPARQRLSLQASSRYGVEREVAAAQRRYSTLARVSDKEFVVPTQVKAPQHAHGVGVGTEYLDPWKITISSRTDRTKTLISDKPFRTTVPRNQLFDDCQA